MNDFKTFQINNKEYRFKSLIFIIIAILLLIMNIVGLALNNWSLETEYYIYCDSKAGCSNPYFGSESCINSKWENTPICTQEYYYYKESYGKEPNWVIKYIYEITIGLIVAGLLLNHFLYNKDVFKDWRIQE